MEILKKKSFEKKLHQLLMQKRI